MGIMLWAIGGISLLFGVLAVATGKSAIHEILGAIGVLIFVVVASAERVAGVISKQFDAQK